MTPALPCSPGNCQSPAVTQALLELGTRATTRLPSSTVLVVRKHWLVLPARFHFNFLFDGLSTQFPRRAVIYTNARASFENNVYLVLLEMAKSKQLLFCRIHWKKKCINTLFIWYHSSPVQLLALPSTRFYYTKCYLWLTARETSPGLLLLLLLFYYSCGLCKSWKKNVFIFLSKSSATELYPKPWKHFKINLRHNTFVTILKFIALVIFPFGILNMLLNLLLHFHFKIFKQTLKITFIVLAITFDTHIQVHFPSQELSSTFKYIDTCTVFIEICNDLTAIIMAHK